VWFTQLNQTDQKEYTMATAAAIASKESVQQIGADTDGNQYLTFQLGEELYGVDILRVQEMALLI
jgi:chemotaxis signal transduction protein